MHHTISNENDSHTRSQAAKKSTLVSAVLNIFLSSFQIITGIFSGSQGLIADGVHSFSDLVADGVVLTANKKSSKPSDDDHHYGHLRYETGASLIIGAILFAVGAGMIWSAGNKLWHPDTIASVHISALWMALFALVVKELLFRYMLRVAKLIQSSMLIANAWHARSDAASSLVVSIGIIGNLLGFPWLDPVAALVVGVLIARMGYQFAADALHDLMDRCADADTEAQIRELILTTPGVQGLHNMKTRKMGDRILVDVHIEVDGSLSVQEGHAIAVAVRDTVVRQGNALNVMTHIDPCTLAKVVNR
ncbi:cation diffusion facilitator family transporter [Yokenella regensburgei]|uniref:cation diffusion facilitator family transporter n=1 Tax=Yokenella regensburgei TaxID=158877 RepID=UPI001376379A|nr:cation diffusion facilitator family transporter [Yokenella regensburgei]KAF1369978.1 cation diffusion facilitator family transporter [Yokenella regensburgei]